MSRFLVGIDLGTTNTACAFVDTASREPSVRLFEIPQLVQPSTVERRAALPSFLYFGTDPEIESGALALPWDARPAAIAGVLARDRGAEAPSRQIASAKSWLVHRAVNRMAAILPWGVDSGPRLSPVDASSRILEHLREAWNASLGSANESARLERQTIVLTVPASFDEEARELTVEAARRAGLTHLTLLEEPIAAFYAWLASDDRTTLGDQNVALVCDVGGGTTDFSLIRVQLDRGRPTFERFATGEHLLLGGDNVAAALAAAVE
jgi:molecular chaperone DnaK (HSP70)